MAAASYFPSIYDDTAENDIWALFHPNPEQLSSLTAGSTKDSPDTDCYKRGAGGNSSITQRVGAEAAFTASGCSAAAEYRPPDVSSAPAPGPGSAPGSEAAEICERCISQKEMELRNMMEEAPGVPQSK
ncbi:hypothetical protein VZT92_003635 [Zoarces viviparus]